MILKFVRYGEKWYARTPAGEFAYGHNQGLYEWLNHKRIDYTCPGRQISSDGALHTVGPLGDAVDAPLRRGFAAAVIPYLRQTN